MCSLQTANEIINKTKLGGNSSFTFARCFRVFSINNSNNNVDSLEFWALINQMILD